VSDAPELWLAAKADTTFKLLGGVVVGSLVILAVSRALLDSVVVACVLAVGALVCAWIFYSLEALFVQVNRAQGTVEIFFRNRLFHRTLKLETVRAVRLEALEVGGYGLRAGSGAEVYTNGGGRFIVFELRNGGRVAVRCTNALMVPAVIEQLDALARR
jgi:hypothetical protein